MHVETFPPADLLINNIPQGRFLLGLSGGIDSVVMFNLLIHHNLDFEVAHVNYGLRGNDSDSDEVFVHRLCQEYSVPIHLHREVPKRYPGNLQDNARRIRYMFFDSVLKTRKLDWIITAHNADDQVETLIMNLARGSGLRGLMGIPFQRDCILRPLLGITRSQILEYAIKNSLVWREDKSNLSLDYTRNRLRIQIIPELKKVFPNLESGVFKSVKNVSHLINATNYMSKCMGLAEENEYGLKIREMDWMQEEFAIFLLFHILQDYGFSEDQCEGALTSLRLKNVGRRFTSSSDYQLYVERGSLQLYLDLKKVTYETALTSKNPVCTAIGRIFKKDETDSSEIESSEISDLVSIPSQENEIHFVRNWRPGDFIITPAGKKRKLSDLLNDFKVPAGLKSVYPVVVNKEGKIIWVPGLKMNLCDQKNRDQAKFVTLILEKHKSSKRFVSDSR